MSLAGTATAVENCIYDIMPPRPYLVLGSRVTPQANYLIVAACGKPIEEVRAALLDRTKALSRKEDPEEEMARRRHARALGDTLTKRRDEARRVAKQAEAEKSWWRRFWN